MAMQPWFVGSAFCTERSRLLDQVSAATTRYSSLTSDLCVLASHTWGMEYERMKAEAEKAREIATRAQEKLQGHRKDHGC
jgi:hypothetical protein